MTMQSVYLRASELTLGSVGWYESREVDLACDAVKVMWARDAREELRQCYRREGVNHLENCKPFVEAYLAAIAEPMFNGAAQGIKKVQAMSAKSDDAH